MLKIEKINLNFQAKITKEVIDATKCYVIENQLPWIFLRAKNQFEF